MKGQSLNLAPQEKEAAQDHALHQAMAEALVPKVLQQLHPRRDLVHHPADRGTEAALHRKAHPDLQREKVLARDVRRRVVDRVLVSLSFLASLLHQ